MDPHSGKGTGNFVFRQLFNPLVNLFRNDKTNAFELTPELAESWEAKGNQITLKLRKGVKFHDGTDWNAEVAKFNIDRMKSPMSGAKFHVQEVKSVDVVDSHTVRLNLTAPSASLLSKLAAQDYYPYMVSKAAVEKYGDDEFAERGIGSGPFQLAEWVKDQKVVVKRFDGYWDTGADGKPLPYLDGIEYRYIRDTAVAVLELRSGGLDAVVSEMPLDLVKTLQGNPEIVIYENPWHGRNYTLTFNARGDRPFTKDVKLRQAAWYALDRDGLAKGVGVGLGKPSFYFWEQLQVGYNDKLPKNNFDQAKSKQLLTEAGYPNGLDLDFTFIARKPDDRTAEAVDQMLNAVGIRSKMRPVEKVAWTAIMRQEPAGTFDMTMFKGTVDYDPDLLGRQFATGGIWNWSSWSNQEMDKCLEDGRSTYDDKQRQEIYERCQKLLFETAYFSPTWLTVRYEAANKRVKNIVQNWSRPMIRYAWLDR